MPINLHHPLITDADRSAINYYTAHERARVNTELCLFALKTAREVLNEIKRGSTATAKVAKAEERLARARYHFTRAVCFGAQDSYPERLKLAAQEGALVAQAVEQAKAKLKPRSTKPTTGELTHAQH